MRAELLSVGTEILLGHLQDTNSHYLAAELPALGIDCSFIHQVGDNVERLATTLRTALARADAVLITGGLGPTDDDVTRDAIAAVCGETPMLDPALAETLREFFARRGAVMPERNLKQARRIPSAEALPNPRGTAPGWWVEQGGKILVAMPGPPAELRGMWEEHVRPRLAARFPGAVIVSRTLKTVGLGESTVDERISPLGAAANPTIGTYAKSDGVHLRLTAKAATEAEARRLIAPLEAAVRDRLGTAVWGADDETLAGAAGAMLRDRGLSLAVMESCTGGLLASQVTDVPGASAYFRGGLVTYTAEAKIRYGVPAAVIRAHGVVSEATARAMAVAARAQLRADVGLGITGVAGPAPHNDQPVGTVHIGLATAAGTAHLGFQFAQPREVIKNRAATMALSLLRRVLLGEVAVESA